MRRFARILPAILALTAGCSPHDQPASPFQGYVEADAIHVASPLPGTLIHRPVTRGANIPSNTPLFSLDNTPELAALAEARGRLAQSQARLDNARKGRRPSEIAALEARLAQARANLELSELELARRERLHRDEVLSPAELDQARTRRDADHALFNALQADLDTARLGARDDEIRAAEDDVAAAEAAVTRAQWSVEQKSRTAPVDALVQDTLFEPGEFVPAGAPVVVLLPPAALKVRFYVPQSELPRATPGAPVHIHLDGLPDALPGTIRFVSSHAEFTPPVIFSRETRQKLVYRVEASFDGTPNPALRPGQPVDVAWNLPR